MERDGDLGEVFEYVVHVHAECGVAFAGEAEGASDLVGARSAHEMVGRTSVQPVFAATINSGEPTLKGFSSSEPKQCVTLNPALSSIRRISAAVKIQCHQVSRSTVPLRIKTACVSRQLSSAR